MLGQLIHSLRDIHVMTINQINYNYHVEYTLYNPFRIAHSITTHHSSDSRFRIQKWIMCNRTNPYNYHEHSLVGLGYSTNIKPLHSYINYKLLLRSLTCLDPECHMYDHMYKTLYDYPNSLLSCLVYVLAS